MSDALFQTKSVIRRLLEARGLSPRKRFGQNFLIDRHLMGKLVDAADIGPNDCVIEVGAGTGSLTGLLTASAGRVVAVEIDPNLAAIAGEQNSGATNLTVLQLDALQDKSTLAPEFTAAVRAAFSQVSGVLMLVANLPYDIATPLVIDLLLSSLPLRRMCFAVQSEVGNRFLAAPSSGAFGPASVVIQALATVRRVCQAPPEAFWPVPKVSTTMLRVDIREDCRIGPDEAAGFARFVRGFFQHRRKTMSHNAKRSPSGPRVLEGMASLGIEPNARPEELTVDQWTSLFACSQGTESGPSPPH